MDVGEGVDVYRKGYVGVGVDVGRGVWVWV